MTLVFLDTETTGVNCDSSSIVQLGAITQRGSVLMNTYCKPTRKQVSKGAEEVHGITPDKYEFAPSEVIAVKTLYMLLEKIDNKEEVVLVGHNCDYFDIPLLQSVSGCDFSKFRSIDTYTLAIRFHPEKDGKLSEFYEALTGNTPTNAHDAVADCIMVIDIMNKMLELPRWDAISLAEYCAEPIVLNKMPFGKHKGWLMEEVPIDYIMYCNDTWGNKHPDIKKTFEHYLEITK